MSIKRHTDQELMMELISRNRDAFVGLYFDETGSPSTFDDPRLECGEGRSYEVSFEVGNMSSNVDINGFQNPNIEVHFFFDEKNGQLLQASYLFDDCVQ